MPLISTQITAHIAKLAALELTQAELARFAPQLSSILEYTTKTSELDISKTRETNQITELENIFRDDVVDQKRQFTQKEALANARQTHNGYFVVPAIL